MKRSEFVRQAPEKQRRETGEALEAMFAEHQDTLLGMLFCLLGNLDAAVAAFQDAFARCWRRREHVPQAESLRVWVFRVTWNVGRETRTAAWRRRRALSEEETTWSSPSDDALEPGRRERLIQVRRALGQLRPEEQEVFFLRVNGLLDYEEIALASRVPMGVVRARMRTALEKLSAALMPDEPEILSVESFPPRAAGFSVVLPEDADSEDEESPTNLPSGQLRQGYADHASGEDQEPL